MPDVTLRGSQRAEPFSFPDPVKVLALPDGRATEKAEAQVSSSSVNKGYAATQSLTLTGSCIYSQASRHRSPKLLTYSGGSQAPL